MTVPDMSPLSGSHPHHPLSQDLIALSTLTPPSPVLRPTHLTSTWSWSEIHVELDFDVDAVISEQALFPVHARADPATGLEIHPSSSVSTVGTVGTFGPIHGRNNSRDIGSWSPTSQYFEESLISKLSANDVLNISRPPSRVSQATLRSFNNDQDPTTPSKLAVGASALQLTSDDTGTIRNEHHSVPSHPTSSHVHGSLLPLNSPANSDDIATFELPDPDILPLVTPPSLQRGESCPTTEKSNIQLTLTGEDSQINALARQLAFAATLATLESKCYSAPFSSQGPQAPPSGDNQYPKRGLPKSLAWLAKTVVEVLIDQEGFREVLARFKYTGYVSPGSPPDRHKYGMVQFRPVNRQIFNFHYAPLESLPVLRRITVNGEESWDYISRQASLGLKANGVYFVRGNEKLSFPVPYTPDEGTTTESSKLHWRFEYMVDDRRVEASGKKTVDGEKVLTPLSFSCSPLLLHPLQGKRIRLMHVVKKSVITKLVAEKMEPPGLRPRIGSPTKTRATMSHIYAYAGNTHKRSATHCTPRDNEDNSVCVRSLPATQLSKTALEAKVGLLSPRRRRASSAGECSRPGSNFVSPYAHVPPLGNSLLCQNIVPRSSLAALLDVDESPRNTSPAATIPPYVDPSSFYPLSPSPRHYRSAIRP